MNKSAFLQLIQQVAGITDQQTDELEKVASAFPYCQTAHLLLAKSAYDKGSMLSSQRLRRASSYATNRQLLKTIIYAAPAPPVPVYMETEEEETAAAAQFPAPVATQPADADAAETVETAAENNLPAKTPDKTSGSAEMQQEESGTLAEPAAKASTPSAPENKPEESLYSELAMLLTINSLSSSSTDLFVARPDKTTVAPAPLPLELLEPAEETPERVNEEIPVTEVTEEAATEEETETEATHTASGTDEAEATPETATALLPPAAATPDKAETDNAAAEEAVEPPYGEINYSSDEIDRLYAEDVLGYWMGSSRMGEVLQLKDDFTRQKPQSFHPELILEYSKTHELEKAIQPATNVLSEQLNIIDQFLKLNPRLKTMANLKLKPEPQEDLSLKSTRIRKGMASENLATIFLKQGKPKKAIKIYEQLILKYPEKKSYFAEQIEKLQTLN